MKKFTRWWVCLGLCLGLLACGALAAEGDISVQLDGQNLTFTDAVPQVKDQRTFLPFRAVFEAMGAEVDNEGNTITAVRGDKTLSMTVGSAEATVTEQGVTTSISMDVAPYVDASTWRTYVPVRFAAQAFGCAVGWDQAAQTAVIVDTEKLVTEAMADKSYTYLEKLAAMGEKYKTGIWNMEAALNADYEIPSILGGEPTPLLNMDGTVKGVMADNAKLDMTMNMKMDVDGIVAMAQGMLGGQLTAEEQARFDALKTDGVDVAVRGDINTGKLYMNMDLGVLGTAMAGSGLDADAWYELDMAALMEQAGMDWGELMAMTENADTLDTLVSALAAAQPNDAANGYNELKKSFDGLFAAFADDHFQLWGSKVPYNFGSCSTHYDLPSSDGFNVGMDLLLTFVSEHDHTLKGYELTFTMNNGTATAEGSPVTMTMTISMDADGKMNAEIEMDMGNMITMHMTMDGSYAPGTTAPVVTPPEGAKIVPFTEMMGQTGDLGIIGGADGPTAIITAKVA